MLRLARVLVSYKLLDSELRYYYNGGVLPFCDDTVDRLAMQLYR